MYEVIVPVKEYVKEFLSAQYSDNPIFLPETNVMSVLLRDKNKFSCIVKPDLYSKTIRFDSEVKIEKIANHNIYKLNNYVELEIRLLMLFRINMRPKNIKDVLLDIIAENNFPDEKFNSLKAYYHDIQRYESHRQTLK